jgi:hypothetical protein
MDFKEFANRFVAALQGLSENELTADRNVVRGEEALGAVHLEWTLPRERRVLGATVCLASLHRVSLMSYVREAPARTWGSFPQRVAL